MFWGADWAWGIPMLLGAIAFHVSGLVALEHVLRFFDRRRVGPPSMGYFLAMMLLASNVVLLMHVIEAAAWALLYIKLGSLDGFAASMLYSLNAITSYGHDEFVLAGHWRLLGAIESVNGVMIFGLTTAFLFSVMRELRGTRLS